MRHTHEEIAINIKYALHKTLMFIPSISCHHTKILQEITFNFLTCTYKLFSNIYHQQH